MSVTINDRIKCDSCGKFCNLDEIDFQYTPDSEHTSELIEHYCFNCSFNSGLEENYEN